MTEDTLIKKPQAISLVLKSVKQIAPYVKHFVFECDKFSYVAGQFITIHFEKEGKMLRRSYSIATSPDEFNKTGCIEFAAGYVEGGPASELLFHLKEGDTLQATGPFGRLILKEEMPKRYVFVSTSTGVTPFRSMLDDLSRHFQNDSELMVVLLEGVQYRKDILYTDDFLNFAAKHPQFTFHACYSREEATGLETHEHIGYVQNLFSQLTLDPQRDIVYLCGNPGMIDESFLLLKEKGFEVKQIFREKYISSK